MKIRFRKLVPEAHAPKQAHPGDAGFDLTATSREVLDNGTQIRYGTGLAVEIPEGYAGLVFPRSGIYKTGMILTNAVGVIDSGYRGEIKAVFDCQYCFEDYRIGDRIGQLVIVPVPEVEYEEAEELSPSERGTGGYGSTGR